MTAINKLIDITALDAPESLASFGGLLFVGGVSIESCESFGCGNSGHGSSVGSGVGHGTVGIGVVGQGVGTGDGGHGCGVVGAGG